MNVIPREEWDRHPILGRLRYKSDFDGDGTLNLKDYDRSELEACKAISIDVSEDGGATWRSCSFSDDIVYIDSVGAGWYWLSNSHPFDELDASTKGKSLATWRAREVQ